MEAFIQQVINGIILGSIYALIAVGLSQIYGIIRVLQWSHGEVYMLGAFLTYYLSSIVHLNYAVSILITMVTMGILGILIEKVVFRPLRKLPMISSTLGAIGLSIIMLNAAILLFSSRPQSFRVAQLNKVVEFGEITMTLQRLLVFFASIILISLLSLFIKKTSIGRAMRAIAEDYETASLMGIDVNRISMVAFTIGSALAGIAGALISPIFSLYPQMSLQAISKATPVVVLGGLGYVEGAIFSGYLLGITEALTSAYVSSSYKDAMAFILLIIVLYFRPEGLFGRSIKDKV